MRSEPKDDSYWFTPSGRHSAETPPTPASQGQAAAPSDSYGSYGQPYGQSAPSAGSAPAPAYQPPAPYQPPPAYQQPPYQPPAPQAPAYQPSTYQQPAYPQPTYQQPAYPQPTQQPAQPAPAGGAGLRQPTGEYPAQRAPSGPLPARRPYPTGAHPQVGRGPGGPGNGRPGNGGRGPVDGPGHGHSHTPTGEVAVSRRTTLTVRWILIPCAIATAVAVVLLWPHRPTAPAQADDAMSRSYGQVTTVTEVACPADLPNSGGPKLPCGTADVRVTSGQGAGQTITVDLPRGAGAPSLSVGDDVVLGSVIDPTTGNATFELLDEGRGKPLLLMLAICAVAVIAFGRLRGITSLIGLAASFSLLLYFILPAILDGASPLLAAIVGSAAIMFAVLYLTHGFSMHTSVAVLGALASLVLTGLLGWLFIASTSLTGFADESTAYLSVLNRNVDMRGLLLAGIIIGALGVLDHVTVAQATTVAELARTATSRLAVYRAAMRMGRARVASAVNTIILAYAGAGLPLLLLLAAGGQDVTDVLTSQYLGEEIVRAAVGTLGLVAAVPITTALGALVVDLRHRAGQRSEGEHDHRVEAVPGR